jgi:outer membrane biosynthesis protein TonB
MKRLEAEFEDEPKEPAQNFFKRFRVSIIVTGVVLVGIVMVAKFSSGGGSSKRDSFTLVSLAPPPPPPPPVMTPPPPPPPDEQKIEEPMVKQEAPKEEAPKDEPPLGTGIKGDGAGDSFGLGGGNGTGRIGGNENGSKWGWYAGQVQSRIQQALQRNSKTRTASISVKVRIWPDPSGRIGRVQLAESTGNPALDTALRDDVLSGLQLDEGPPPGMPAPITLRIVERRPH